MKNPYLNLHTSPWPELAELGWQRLNENRHGDLPVWLEAIKKLLNRGSFSQLDRDAPKLGFPVADKAGLQEQLIALHPWRKGPLELGGVYIDTEWRSDWKWNRLAPHIDLAGQKVLDIGCGNGYFGLRMLGVGAELVLGVDPTLVFVMQSLAMQRFCPILNNYVLPLAIEDLPGDTNGFDSVFSMGVLYHRRNPVEHLERLTKLARPAGQVVLETLVLDEKGKRTLQPQGRYARMRNVHAIPTIETLQDWMSKAGLNDTKVLDVCTTTTEEQRSTDWMTFESLEKSLDPLNQALTVEGHPAPVRVAILAKT